MVRFCLLRLFFRFVSLASTCVDMDVTNVLLRVKESKRILVLHRNGREAAIRSAVRSVDGRIHDVFDHSEDIPSNALPYILQRYNAEWEDYVDVADVDVILDRDRLLVIPAQWLLVLKDPLVKDQAQA